VNEQRNICSESSCQKNDGLPESKCFCGMAGGRLDGRGVLVFDGAQKSQAQYYSLLLVPVLTRAPAVDYDIFVEPFIIEDTNWLASPSQFVKVVVRE
jgi:hypothetical protein